MDDRNTNRFEKPSDSDMKMSTMSRSEKHKSHKKSSAEKTGAEAGTRRKASKKPIGAAINKFRRHRRDVARIKAAEKRAEEIDQAAAVGYIYHTRFADKYNKFFLKNQI